MRKKLIISLSVLTIGVASLFVGCNSVAKKGGGTMTVDLPENKKLLEATWKEDDSLWYLTRDMRDDEKAETYEFKEKSNFGVMEGKVIFKEVKK